MQIRPPPVSFGDPKLNGLVTPIAISQTLPVPGLEDEGAQPGYYTGLRRRLLSELARIGSR